MLIALIDYGCHSFCYRLASALRKNGVLVDYLVNGSLQSPNLSSLATWMSESPTMLKIISCSRPYGKIGLYDRLRGEREWGQRCIAALDGNPPEAIVVNCLPLGAVAAVQRWALRRQIPFVYWLQDIQSRAIHDLLGRKLGHLGRTLGAMAHIWEQEILENSDMVITIAPGHEKELPHRVRQNGRYTLLENWANIEEFATYSPDNEWSASHGLNRTQNIVYSGTLGLKHELDTFLALAERLQSRPEARIVIVSSDQAAYRVRDQATMLGLKNLIVLPFQSYTDVPKVLASAAVLIAPLAAAAGAFCVPSKILSYLCAGRPTVLAIDQSNSAAQTIIKANAGYVVKPGEPSEFVNCVEKLLDSHDLRLQFGAAARAYAESTFRIEVVVERFMKIISRVSPVLQPATGAKAAIASLPR